MLFSPKKLGADNLLFVRLIKKMFTAIICKFQLQKYKRFLI